MDDDTERLTTLRDITAGFDGHELDAILQHFADDAVFESPRGPDRWGQRFAGKKAIRSAFAGRFAGIPDVRSRQDKHFVAGNRGASEWTLTGSTAAGERLEIRGCDLWTFRDGWVVKKDSYWKIRTVPPPEQPEELQR